MSPLIAAFWYWEQTEVSILGADQKDGGLWGRECSVTKPELYMRITDLLNNWKLNYCILFELTLKNQ